jgi:hypothetical protein
MRDGGDFAAVPPAMRDRVNPHPFWMMDLVVVLLRRAIVIELRLAS